MRMAITDIADWRSSLNRMSVPRSILGVALLVLAVLSSACGGTHRSGQGRALYVGTPSIASAKLAAQQPCKTGHWATIRVADAETIGQKTTTTFFTIKC